MAKYKFWHSSLLYVLILLPTLSLCCLLCPINLPGKPQALDQFRLPSVQKLLQTAETFEWLCQNGSKLSDVSADCRAEVSHLFCSLSQLAQSLRAECPGAEEPQACSKCRADTDSLYSANKWVIQWLDSVGKMPAGISDGNYHWLGDYEQCQRLKELQLFNGRYCLLEFHVPDAVLRPEQCPERGADPLEVVLGICLPANCSRDETRGLVEYAADHRPISVNCEPSQRWPLPGLLLATICLCWLAALLAISTLRWFRPQLVLPQSLEALCLQTNLRHSLRTTLPPGEQGQPQFQALAGLQVLTVSLMVLGQAQVLVLPYLENLGHHYALLERWMAQPVLHPTLLADSLLALSAFQLGLCPAQSVLQTLRRRFLRLWPAYALITLGMAFVFARLGQGPMWSRTDIARRCAGNWAQNLLLVQNLLGHAHTCLDAGTLLALEAQFLLLSLLLMRLLAARPRVLLGVLATGVTISALFCLGATLFWALPPALLSNRRLEPRHFGPLADLLVLNPLARAGAPLVGLLFSLCLLPRIDGQAQHLLRALAPVGTLLALATLGLLLWAPFWLPAGTSPLGVLYAAFHRSAWAFLLLTLLLLLEANPKGGVLAKFLRWRVFRPLARLLFPVLLLAEPIALATFASLHRPVHSTPLSAMLTFVGVLVCSFLLAFGLDCAISRPIRRLCLCRIGHGGNTDSDEEKQTNKEEEETLKK